MKKLVLGSMSLATCSVIVILMSGFFTGLFANLNTAFEKVIETGDTSYFATVGENSWNDLCATVDDIPLISDIKGMLEKQGVDSKTFNVATGTGKSSGSGLISNIEKEINNAVESTDFGNAYEQLFGDAK